MVKGIYSAGNDSAEVIKELKQFIIKFINDGRLERKQGLEILFELNCVSGV
jgi:predicted RNase H-like HicB family nuclease